MSVKLTKVVDQRVITSATKEEELTGTVLDPEFLKDGVGEIDLPRKLLTIRGRVFLYGRDEPYSINPDANTVEDWMLTSNIKIPHIPNYEIVSGVETIDTIRWKANNLLKACAAFSNGDISDVNLQSSLCRLQDQLVQCILGKNGVLTGDILSVRCKNSMRAVAVPEPALDPFEVELPSEVAQAAGISEGDWVFLVRQPVLFEGGIILQQARLWNKQAIGCNAFVNKPLGLDFDGDTVAVFLVPTWKKSVHDELLDKPLQELKQYAQWTGEMLLYNSAQQIDWNDPMADIDRRTVVDGTTFGPTDALDIKNSRFVALADISGCKAVLEDVPAYGNGISIQRFLEESFSAHHDIVRMKVQIGAIGAVTDKISQLILQQQGPAALTYALRFKELVTQTMLDAKHGTGSYQIEPIIEIFERRGIWSKASEKDAINFLADMGLHASFTRPIVEILWQLQDVFTNESGKEETRGIGVTEAIRRNLPLFATTRYGVGPADLIKYIESPSQEFSAAQHTLNAANVETRSA